jgi:hypothetical protein
MFFYSKKNCIFFWNCVKYFFFFSDLFCTIASCPPERTKMKRRSRSGDTRNTLKDGKKNTAKKAKPASAFFLI